MGDVVWNLCAQVRETTEQLNSLLVQIQGIVGYVADAGSVQAPETARMLFAVKTAHEDLDKATKGLYHVKDALDKNILPAKLEAAGVDLIRVPELARSFSVNEKTSASFIDKERGFDWLREIGQGDLIQETVNAGTLSTFIRNLQMEQGIDPPDDIVKVSTYKTISVTKYTPK